MLRLLLSTLIGCLWLAPLPALPFGTAQDPLPPLSASETTSLRTGERVTRFYDHPDEIALLPETAFAAHILRSLDELEPRIGVETLYLLPLPSEVTGQPEFSLRLYNVLRSISTMEGIEYYSASRGRMRVFYVESYAIGGPQDRRRIADPLVGSVPPHDRIYAYQQDSSFGRNTYSLDYRHQAGQLGLTMVNLTRMSYGIVPLVGDGNLEIHLAIIPTTEGLLFYGNCGVRVIGLFGMQDRVQNSFSNRIDAIYRWFSSRVIREFGL